MTYLSIQRFTIAPTRIALIIFAVVSLAAATRAEVTIHVSGYQLHNELSAPGGVPRAVGDLAFSADGNTAYFVGDSEEITAGVWTAPVSRDASGNVTGFGTASFLFSDDYIDTGLFFYPGSTTLMYRGHYDSVLQRSSISQRLANGTIEHTFIDPTDYDAEFGGMTYVPGSYPNAGSLLSVSYRDEQIHSHTVTDDGDGSFTIGSPVLYADSTSALMEGDLAFITTGNLANTIIFADFTNNSVAYFDVDPLTGLPVGGTTPTTNTFLSGFISNAEGPWGLAVDPITDNIFVTLFDNEEIVAPIFQISAATVVPEPSSVVSLSLVMGALVGWRRRRRADPLAKSRSCGD